MHTQYGVGLERVPGLRRKAEAAFDLLQGWLGTKPDWLTLQWERGEEEDRRHRLELTLVDTQNGNRTRLLIRPGALEEPQTFVDDHLIQIHGEVLRLWTRKYGRG